MLIFLRTRAKGKLRPAHALKEPPIIVMARASPSYALEMPPRAHAKIKFAGFAKACVSLNAAIRHNSLRVFEKRSRLSAPGHRKRFFVFKAVLCIDKAFSASAKIALAWRQPPAKRAKAPEGKQRHNLC
jgi:hypothetical protein